MIPDPAAPTATGRPDAGVRPPGVRPIGVLLLGVAFTLLTTAGELALQVLREVVLDRGRYVRAGHVWYTLLADAALIAVPTLVLLLVAAARRRRGLALPTVVTVLAFFSGLALAFYLRHKVAPLALVVLAAGLAATVGRVAAARPALVRRLLRLTTPVLAALVPALGLGVTGWRLLGERQAMAALPAARAGAPNVLLIILDTVRASSVSLYGYARPTTPRLEAVAREGTRFDLAIAPSSWTLPSHATLFTGRYPREVRSTLRRKPLDGRHPTLAERLREQGYVTAGFAANHAYGTFEYGLNRGFVHYEDLTGLAQLLGGSALFEHIAEGPWPLRLTGDRVGRRSAPMINRDFLRWLPDSAGRPFFVFLNYFDAHNPYVAPEPFRRFRSLDASEAAGLAEGASEREDEARAAHDPRLVRWLTDQYENCIAALDHQVGILLDSLERRGVLDNTLVIITSDHGETLGEHGRALRHATGLYLTELHVPLVLRFPGRVPAGAAVAAPITLRDIPATVLDLLGLAETAPMPGSSLARFWAGADSAARRPARARSETSPMPGWTRAYFPVAKGDMYSVVSDRLHYILNGDGREELYRLDDDPREQRDLAARPEHRATLAALRSMLDSAIVHPGSAPR